MAREVVSFGDVKGSAKGRSGVLRYTEGVEVMETNYEGEPQVMLSPLTSRGEPSTACWIEVPVDSLDGLIAALRRIRAGRYGRPPARELPAVPADFPVKVLGEGEPAQDRVTCGECGRSWDDAIGTTWTPAPAGRCPFESFHADPE